MALSSLLRGVVIGLVLGAAYVASPLTVWFLLAMVGLYWCAGRGLAGRERQLVWGILSVAVGVRVVAISALFLASHPHVTASFPWDGDGLYLKHRAMAIRNVWLGIPVSPIDLFNAFDHAYGWSTYLYVLAYLQFLTGPAPYGVHLFNVMMFVAAALILHRLARAAYGRVPALLGLILMMGFPTLIVWSASALKEALYIFLCAVGIVAAIMAIRAPRTQDRAFAAVLLGSAIAINSTVRTGASVIMIAGVALGLACSFVVRRVALVLCVAVFLPLAAFQLWESPAVQARVMSEVRTAATLHLGNVRTEGHPYKLLDQRIYSNDAIQVMTPVEGLRFVVRALSSVIAVPLPWQVASTTEIVFLAEQVIWYLLVAMAFVGLIAGCRRDALLTCMLAGISVTGGAVIALNSGNIGSMVRLRDTIVPFLVWLSALGATSVVSRMAQSSISAEGVGDTSPAAATLVDAASM